MNNKIKVCFPFVGNSIGGSHISTLELISSLDKNLFDIIIVLHKKGDLFNYLRKKKIKFFYFPVFKFIGQEKGYVNNFFILLKSFFQIIRFIKFQKIHILHTNDASIHLTWSLPVKFSKCKLVWHQRIKYPQWRMYKFFSFFSDQIICISNYVLKSLPNNLKHKAKVIYNPISLVDRDNNKEAKKKLQKITRIKKKKILFLANIIKSKKIDIFIKSAFLIYKNNPNCIFLIIGSDKLGIFKKFFKNFRVDKNFKKNIYFLDQCFLIKSWLRACDVLLVPAINEGYNRTIVESLLANLPVIVSDSGGHKEAILKDKKLFVNPNDYHNFALKTLNFLKLNKNQSKFIINKQMRTIKIRHNNKIIKEKIQKIYRNINK